MSPDHKPSIGFSLDLDNLWSYLKIRGDAAWEKYPSFLNTFVPYVLDVLDSLDLKITFFVVGQDAVVEDNFEALRMIVARGHEIGNHSFNHEPWLPLYNREDLRREVLLTEEHIHRVTGQKTVGFRGPGYVWTPELLEILHENGYLYDATTLPTSIGPIARTYYFLNNTFDPEEKEKRKYGFGTVKDAVRPVKPYYWLLPSGAKLLEIPVTTIPCMKVPFHTSYLLYLSQVSTLLMAAYLKFAIHMCRLTSTEPSFLLHPLDLISGEQYPELNFFPGMNVDENRKLQLVQSIILELKKYFKPVNIRTHAGSYLSRAGLKIIPVS